LTLKSAVTLQYETEAFTTNPEKAAHQPSRCASQQVGTCNFCCEQEVKGTVLFEIGMSKSQMTEIKSRKKIMVFIQTLIFQSQTMRIFR
jgi:hypothetical protein